MSLVAFALVCFALRAAPCAAVDDFVSAPIDATAVVLQAQQDVAYARPLFALDASSYAPAPADAPSPDDGDAHRDDGLSDLKAPLPTFSGQLGVAVHASNGGFDARTSLQAMSDRIQFRYGPALLVMNDVFAAAAQAVLPNAPLNVVDGRIGVGAAFAGLATGMYLSNPARLRVEPEVGAFGIASVRVGPLWPLLRVDVGTGMAPLAKDIRARADVQLNWDIVSGVGMFGAVGTDVLVPIGASDVDVAPHAALGVSVVVDVNDSDDLSWLCAD